MIEIETAHIIAFVAGIIVFIMINIYNNWR